MGRGRADAAVFVRAENFAGDEADLHRLTA